MTSVIEICNEALSLVGTRSTITSLEEDSAEARQCNLRYATVRDQLLGIHNWEFARKMQSAALLKAAPGTPENTESGGPWTHAWPPAPWLYSYSYPTDAIRVRAVVLQPYAISGQTAPIFPYAQVSVMPELSRPTRFVKSYDQTPDGDIVAAILTNTPKALVVYTARVENPQFFDTLFRVALINALASEIAFALTGDRAISMSLAEKTNGVILAARVASANEGLTAAEHVPDWLRVRGVAQPGSTFDNYSEPFAPLFGVV